MAICQTALITTNVIYNRYVSEIFFAATHFVGVVIVGIVWNATGIVIGVVVSSSIAMIVAVFAF